MAAGPPCTVVEGDLCAATERVIAHQTKCCNKSSLAGVAKALFERWPEANLYSERARNAADGGDGFDVPGQVHVRLTHDGKAIANLNAQAEQGRTEPGMSVSASQAQRAQWFQQCLAQLPAALEAALGERPPAVALPYMVGCDRAGGEWAEYDRMLRAFQQSTGISVVLYRLQETNRSGKGRGKGKGRGGKGNPSFGKGTEI